MILANQYKAAIVKKTVGIPAFYINDSEKIVVYTAEKNSGKVNETINTRLWQISPLLVGKGHKKNA